MVHLLFYRVHVKRWSWWCVLTGGIVVCFRFLKPIQWSKWLSVINPDSVRWSPDVRFAIADFIQYSRIFEEHVHESLLFFYSLSSFSAIRVFSRLNFVIKEQENRNSRDLSEIECYWASITSLKVYKNHLHRYFYPSCNF